LNRSEAERYGVCECEPRGQQTRDRRQGINAINIAARLEQGAKEIGETCIFSAEVANALPQDTTGFEPRGEVDVRGISELVAICRYALEG
jgi:hypothetical protein